MKSIIFLYGPPGSGKTTTGKLLAAALGLPFVDLDEVISALAGRSIPEIFAVEGEASFRKLEADCLLEKTGGQACVVALGGGALLAQASRAAAEASGRVICLTAEMDHLHLRLQTQAGARPLLGKTEETEKRLAALLERRAGHYASFAHRLDTSRLSPEQAAWQIQIELGLFRISGMGDPYDVLVQRGSLADLGGLLAERGLKGPVVLVSDANVAPLHAGPALESLQRAGFKANCLELPAGEAHKTIASVGRLWEAFLSAGLERGSTVVALGGGVVTDMSGFAAATYLRGMRWVGLPSTLLGMADASLGGKTGVDLPQGKNLVGAFHPPALVLADPELLQSLPEAELRNGLGEVVKHGILADPGLFDLCARGWAALAPGGDWSGLVRRAMAVKIQTIQADPYEKGLRAALNLGHTLGHAVETASNFQLKHGEAVAIGMVGEARLAERIGLARAGLADTIAAALAGLGLPVEIPPGIERSRLLPLMQVDKKKAAGKVRFALPVRIGEVKTGVVVEREDLEWMIAN